MLEKTHSQGINRLPGVTERVYIIAHRYRRALMSELALENMHGHARLGKIGGVTVPEVVKPDVRQLSAPGNPGEISPVNVPGVERPAVGLAEHQSLVVVGVPEADVPPVLFLPVVGQGVGKGLRDRHGIMPVGFGSAPDLAPPEAVELLPENDLPDDKIDRRPAQGQRFAGARPRQDDSQVQHVVDGRPLSFGQEQPDLLLIPDGGRPHIHARRIHELARVADEDPPPDRRPKGRVRSPIHLVHGGWRQSTGEHVAQAALDRGSGQPCDWKMAQFGPEVLPDSVRVDRLRRGGLSVRLKFDRGPLRTLQTLQPRH